MAYYGLSKNYCGIQDIGRSYEGVECYENLLFFFSIKLRDAEPQKPPILMKMAFSSKVPVTRSVEIAVDMFIFLILK